MPMLSEPWTDERSALCLKLWRDGYSASQIAAELGGVTRNAVIDKIHRIGGKGKGGSVIATSKGQKEKGLTKRRAGFRLPVVQALRPTRPIDLPDHLTPLEQRQSLLELTNWSCRYPIVGDPRSPGFFFCGGEEADVAAGRPYCKRHSLRVWQPRRLR
jgi:GcrA cell cycle regulator